MTRVTIQTVSIENGVYSQNPFHSFEGLDPVILANYMHDPYQVAIMFAQTQMTHRAESSIKQSRNDNVVIVIYGIVENDE